MKHVPNLLTVARLLATPYLFSLVWRHEYPSAIVWFIVLGLTDVIDGFLARHFHAASRLGAILDPIADKMLLSGMFLVLALAGLIDPWLAVVVLGRDGVILLGAGAFAAAGRKREFPPSVWGKLSTFGQVLSVCFRLGTLAHIPVEMVATVLAWAVVALAVISLGDYARRTLA